MHLYYSAATNGFFDDRLHATLPADAVAIADEHHAELLALQSAGRVIQPAPAGNPVARTRVVTIEQRRLSVIAAMKAEAARRILAVASMIVQSNDNALLAQAAIDLAANGATTIDAAPALDRRRRIDAIRAASNAAEAAIGGMSVRALAAFIPSAATHWPD